MRPQRRGILVTSLVLGLTLLAVGLSVALAAGITATPSSGPRDDGASAPTQTKITVSGDLSDTATFDTSPQAYWDLPNPSVPNSSYEMTYDSRSLQTDGSFSVVTKVPLYDASAVPVRPGLHHITVCATPITSRIPICVTTGFKVLKGTASFSKSSGRPGDLVTVSGTHWVPGSVVPNEELRITWDPAGSAIGLTSNFKPGSSSWSTAFYVPGVLPGTYKIRICSVPYSDTGPSDCAPADTVVKTFTVVPPTVTLNKSSGKSGDSVKVSGSQFFSNYPLHLFFGPKDAKLNDSRWIEILPGTAKSTNTDGNFGPYAFAASGAAGDYSVLACSEPPTLLPSDVCDKIDLGEAPYTILAAPTPTPTPSPTPSPTPTPTASPTASPTPSPTPTASATPSPTASPTPTSAPTATPSPSPSPALTPTPSAAPTATPSPSPVAALSWPQYLGGPDTVFSRLDLATVGGISLLALLIAFLVPFPGTLFNKTVEANYEEIRGWVAGGRRRWNGLLDTLAVGPLGSVRRRLGSAVTGRFGVLIFLALSALIYGFLSPNFGLDSNSLALFLGLLVGLLFIVVAFDLPLRIYHGRRSRGRDSGVLRALWWTLLVALICVAVSRLAGFQPGYLYGLVISIVFVTEISTREEGVGTWLASVWLLALSFLGWIVLAFVRQQIGDPWISLFLQTVLVTFVVAGIETLAIGLLPMRFLPGHPLYSWRGIMWFPLFALAIFGYLLILVDPANGYLSNDSRTPMLVGLIFLVTFGAVSIGTWAYFRFRPARVGGDRPGEAAET